VISIDTNLLIYARIGNAPWHDAARTFLQEISDSSDVVIAELVLVEYYLALRNPALLDPPLSAARAVAECHAIRTHPRWALVENANVMDAVWAKAKQPGFARRRIIDVRLAKTLLIHGVTDFATANVKDFKGLGFDRVWNPLG
jgi:toxin-antitoxin system PIN domain toxin